FSAYDNVRGRELWKSNGVGAQIVRDINAFTDSSSPASFAVVGSQFFFVADDGINGRELWRSNGTASGTVLVKDINPAAPDGFPFNYASQLINVNGTLLFTAT